MFTQQTAKILLDPDFPAEWADANLMNNLLVKGFYSDIKLFNVSAFFPLFDYSSIDIES